MDKLNNADFGVNFFLENQKDMMINEKVIEAIYQAICAYATEKPQDPLEIPEGADDGTVDKIKADNESI